MTDNLLPCPNPWGQDLDSHKIHLELNDDGLWCWACSCGIQGPKRLTQSKATEAWNRRAHMDMGNLQRSEVVHANMILYRIAKLTPAQVAHLYTGGECAEIVAEIQRQRPEAVKPAQPDTRKWQPIETAPRKTEILLAWHDGTKWHQDTGWVEDWEPDLSPEQMRWMPLPSLPALRAQKEGK